MDIKMVYNNGMPPFDISLPVVRGWGTPIVELQIEKKGGRSRDVAIFDYIMQLQSAFRELIDQSDSSIENLKITDFYLLKEINKTGKNIDFIDLNGEISKTLKYNIILYNIIGDSFNEYLYFTRDSCTKSENDKIFKDHIINEAVISRKTLLSERFVQSMIASVELNFPDYNIQVDELNKKLIYTYKGVPLKSIDDVKKDDIFVFFKLLEVLYHRGEHFGIFFMNCNSISVNVLKAILTFLKLYYLGKNNLIFLYNVPLESKREMEKIKREIVVLPNLRLNDKKK